MIGHVESKKNYTLIFLALIVLTAVTSVVSYVDMGPFNTVVALVIAVIKMLLVALFFMHVRYSSRLTKLVVVGGLAWLALLLFLSMSDFVSRNWLSPGH